MARQLIRDFISLQHVLERSDLEAKFLGNPHQHQYLVLAVGMRVHQALSMKDLENRLSLQVPSRRDMPFAVVEVFPRLFIIESRAELDYEKSWKDFDNGK